MVRIGVQLSEGLLDCCESHFQLPYMSNNLSCAPLAMARSLTRFLFRHFVTPLFRQRSPLGIRSFQFCILKKLTEYQRLVAIALKQTEIAQNYRDIC
jgi:hypothetical protein